MQNSDKNVLVLNSSQF